MSAGRGDSPGSAPGPGGENGFRRQLLRPLSGSAGWAPPPPRAARPPLAGKAGGAAAGPEARVPVRARRRVQPRPDLPRGEISEAQDGICPSFLPCVPPPAVRLSRHDHRVYAFLPPFLPYVRSGPQPAGSGEVGEENGRFSSAVSGLPARLRAEAQVVRPRRAPLAGVAAAALVFT